ncbi:PAS domain S-box protein [Ekhidna sp.]|uniref:PAS domain S-box protein n=1 Tax=Ekhidna sp. TaxID=2608089 RepID=UPI003CCBFFEB
MDHQLIKYIDRPIVILDMDQGHFADCNDAAVKFFGLPKEELLKKSPYDLSPANVFGYEAEAYSRQLIQEALAGDNPSFDWVHLDKKGKKLPCEVRLIRIPPYNRRLVRGTIIDKNDKDRILRRASEGRLILTLESANIGTFDWYPQVDQLSWDQRLYEIFGLKLGDQIDLNAHFFDALHPDDKERVSLEFEKSLSPEGPDSKVIEYRVIIHGKIKHLLAHSRIIRNDKGDVIRMLGATQDITDLRETEDFMKLVLDSAGIGTFSNHPKTDEANFDHRFREIFGIDQNQKGHLTEAFFSRIHEDDLEFVRGHYESRLKKNGPNDINLEYRIVVEGKVKHILGFGQVFRDKKGEVIRIVGTIQDITPLRASEDKLKKSEELLRSVIQDQKEMIVRWKPGGYRTFVNKAYCETFDLNPNEAIGKSFFPLLEKSFLEEYKEEVEKLTPGNPVRSYTVHNPLPSGEKVWQEWSDRAYFDAKGNAVEYQSVGRDVTSLIKSREQLKESEQLFRSIVQDQSEMIVRWTGEGVRTFANKAYMDTFGLKEDEVIGSSFFDLIDEEDLPWVMKEFEQLTPDNPTRSKRHKVKLPDGSLGWQEWTDRAFFDEDRKVKEFQSVGRNITEIVNAQKALEESERRYRNVFNQQFQFTALLDLNGKIVQINDLPLQVHGLEKKDFIGKLFWKAPGFGEKKKYQQRVKDHLKKLKEEGNQLMVEDQYVDPKGNTRYATSHYSLIKDTNGEVENILVQATDKTEIIEAQKALKESELRYRNVFNQQFQFTALLDIEGKVVLINDLPLQTQGVSREDYIGKYFWESPSWKGNKEWEKKIKSQVLFAKKTGETLIVEDPYYGKNKEIRYANASYNVIANNKGKAENILVQALDITEAKNAKREIEDRQKKLSLIFDNANDFMILFRVEGSQLFIESVNEETIKGFKNSGIEMSEDDLVGLEIREYFQKVVGYDENTMAFHMEKYKEALKNKETITYISDNTVNDLYFAIETKITPVEESNETNYLLTTSRDITEIVLSRKELENALDEVRELKEKLEQENIYLKEEIKQANDFENMVFRSKEFRGVLQKVEQVAKTDATVLITGETGTGKELIARAIHNVSKRSEKSMIKVNTAAIPRDLIESELFGHEKGAFTGAAGERPGKFELADGGTIFLDEIGDMPMDLQVKILRVLQEGEVERLGSTKTKKIDVRIISATNKNLEEAVTNGSFREDLYFRLKVFPIEIPPLRTRPDDVPILVEHFVAKYSVKHSNPINVIPKTVMDYLRNYTWPGNVRELENTIERAVILSTDEKLDLPEVTESTTSQEQWEHDNSLDVIMENHIRTVLKESNWKIEGDDGAAAKLKIKPSTLRDKMKKFNIKRPR